jgi:hypothetical protein
LNCLSVQRTQIVHSNLLASDRKTPLSFVPHADVVQFVASTQLSHSLVLL